MRIVKGEDDILEDAAESWLELLLSRLLYSRPHTMKHTMKVAKQYASIRSLPQTSKLPAAQHPVDGGSVLLPVFPG